VRVLNYRSGKSGASIRCQLPGRKPIVLHAGRKDFTEVEMVFAYSGAFAQFDPPYPAAGNLSMARYGH
jgi:hypothetical protein